MMLRTAQEGVLPVETAQKTTPDHLAAMVASTELVEVGVAETVGRPA
jgi:hypothetical protein